MVEFVALEIDFSAASFLGQAFGKIERGRTPHIMRHEIVQLFLKLRIGLGIFIGFLEFQNGRHQSLGDITPAKVAKTTIFIREGDVLRFTHGI